MLKYNCPIYFPKCNQETIIELPVTNPDYAGKA